MPDPAKNSLARRWRVFMQDESGVTLIEYGLIAMLITAILVVFVDDLSTQKLWNVFTDISSGLENMRQQAEE